MSPVLTLAPGLEPLPVAWGGPLPASGTFQGPALDTPTSPDDQSCTLTVEGEGGVEEADLPGSESSRRFRRRVAVLVLITTGRRT